MITIYCTITLHCTSCWATDVGFIVSRKPHSNGLDLIYTEKQTFLDYSKTGFRLQSYFFILLARFDTFSLDFIIS